MAGKIGEARVVINFNTHEGIELTKLSTSFKALANLYKDFVFNKIEHKEGKTKGLKAKLHTTSIKNNCVELHLAILLADCAAVTLSDPLLAKEFVKYVSGAIKCFKDVGLKGIASLSGSPYKKSEINNIEKTLQAIESNIDAGFGIKAIEYDGATKSLKAKFFNHKDVELALKGIREIKKELANAPKIAQQNVMTQAIPSPPEPTITSDGGIIHYKSAVKSFSAKIERITTTNYDATTQEANIIGSHALNERFTCTQQKYDEIVNFTKIKE